MECCSNLGVDNKKREVDVWFLEQTRRISDSNEVAVMAEEETVEVHSLNFLFGSNAGVCEVLPLGSRYLQALFLIFAFDFA